jgi:hypothetical protein
MEEICVGAKSPWPAVSRTVIRIFNSEEARGVLDCEIAVCDKGTLDELGCERGSACAIRRGKASFKTLLMSLNDRRLSDTDPVLISLK